MCKRNSDIRSKDDTSLPMTEAQKKCIANIFKNCEQAIGGIVDLIEDPYGKISIADLKQILPKVCKDLDNVLSAAKKGTFCALSADECKHVSYFVGCEGVPMPGTAGDEQVTKPLSKLKIL